MAKISKTIKEILQIVVFLLVVGALVTVYVVCPLGQVKTIMGRTDVGTWVPDSLSLNDGTVYTDAGLAVDTFRVEADGLTTLAGLYIPAISDSITPSKGTVVLLHADRATRDSLLEIARILHDSGFVVVVYDQRASGLSTGKYRGDGYYEAADLEAVISNLELRGQIQHPLSLVGWDAGADAGLLATIEEQRIDRVVAIAPYLTTKRMQDLQRKSYDTFWFPFYRTMMWWWYNIRSGYAAPYRKLDNIRPVNCQTLIMIPADNLDDEAVARIKQQSSPEKLQLQTLPEDPAELQRTTISFLMANGA